MREATKIVIVQEINIDISESEILRYQGYTKPSVRPTDAVREFMQAAIHEGYLVVEPQAVCTTIKDITVQGGQAGIDSTLVLHMDSAIKAWRGLTHLALAVCTIGPALEARVTQLFKEGDYASALMLDSVGSVAVESVADYVNSIIGHDAHDQGLGAGPRFSLGYGQWQLSDQRAIFCLLAPALIGVHLNKNYMMIPRKSVSFCVGIGKGVATKTGANPCRHCTKKDCRYQRHTAPA